MPDISLDWIFALVLLASLLLGAWRGLVYEVLSLVNWVAAFILAQWLANDVAHKLPMSGASEAIRYTAAFALIFVLSVFVGGLLVALIKKLFAAVGLQAADRALGAVFGVLRGVIVLLSATVIVSMTPLHRSAWWQDSVATGLAQTVLQGLRPVMPQEFGKYLP
jgi:membrane protein required for colicin V production